MEAKLRQYEEGEKFVAAVEEAGGPALLDRVWRGPEWLPSLAEIGNPAEWITRVGHDLLTLPPAEPGSRWSPSILDRCTFPPSAERAYCGVSGGPDSLALLALATWAGCRVTAVHVDHGLRPGSACRGRRGGAGRRPVRCRLPSPAKLELVDGPNLEARARDGPSPCARPRCGHRPHRRRPGGDGAGQPPAGCRCRRDGRHARRRPPPHPGPAPFGDGCALRRSWGWSRSSTRRTTIPASSATASAMSSSACARVWPAATWSRSWPARRSCWPAMPTCWPRWLSWWTPPTAGRWSTSPSRSAGEPCGGGSGETPSPPVAGRRGAGARRGPGPGQGHGAARRSAGQPIRRTAQHGVGTGSGTVTPCPQSERVISQVRARPRAVLPVWAKWWCPRASCGLASPSSGPRSPLTMPIDRHHSWSGC